MREEIAETCGSADAAAFEGFVDWLRRLYAIELPHFIDRNYNSPLGLLASPLALAELVRLGAFGRLGAAVRRRFRDPRLHRLFSFQAMYAGLAPDEALALYAVITYMDSIEGVWFPEGGMHAVPVAMALAAEKAGAVFRYGDPVEAVLRSPSGRVAGVRLSSGGQLRADAVVCTIDLPVAYETVLPDLRGRRAGLSRYSPVGGGLARRRSRDTTAGRCSPQHPLRGRMGCGVRRAVPRRETDAGPVASGERAVAETIRRSPRRDARRSTSWSRCRTSPGRSTGTRRPRRCGNGCRDSLPGRDIRARWSPRSW